MKKGKKVFKLDFYGRKIIVEHGELAKQATGSVLVRYNDTVVLTAVVVNKNVAHDCQHPPSRVGGIDKLRLIFQGLQIGILHEVLSFLLVEGKLHREGHQVALHGEYHRFER